MANEEKLTGERPSGGDSARTIIVVLLVAAVIAAIFMCGVLPYMTYRWATQYTQEKDVETAVEAEMLVLEVPTLYSDGKLEICLRNAGSAAVQIDTVYKNGKIVAADLNQELPGNDTTCFTLPGTYAPDDDVNLITKKGTQVRFKVEG